MKGAASEQKEYEVRLDAVSTSKGSVVDILRGCRSLDGTDWFSDADWVPRELREPSSIGVQRFEIVSVFGHSGGRVPMLAFC